MQREWRGDQSGHLLGKKLMGYIHDYSIDGDVMVVVMAMVNVVAL
jgi:hypothetical protein